MKHMAQIGAQEIRSRESQFPLFLLSIILTLIALPISNLHGNAVERFFFPLAMSALALQSIRALPAWQGRIYGIPLCRLYVGLGIIGALSAWIPYSIGHHLPLLVRVLFASVRAGFYVMTAIRIIQVIANSARVNPRLLSLGAAGYIHLGLTAGQFATLMQLLDADSFRLGELGSTEELVTRLSYFTFVTIGTLGYGDVVPASPLGECFVVLLSISSTLYVSLLIGLLLGRYISSRTKKSLVQVEEALEQ